MDLMTVFQKFTWCKSNWSSLKRSKETNELLKQCMDLPQMELTSDVDEVITRSKAFPIAFPINSVRLESLKNLRPVERLNQNIVMTYPLLHERVLLLMSHFLTYKRKFGSSIEKEFYKEMGVPQLIDRLLKKRAISFVGAKDKYVLLNGEKGCGGWELVGTTKERPPLVLADCLSYDEMKLSAMLFVSGPTECINDGERRNRAVYNETDIEKHAVIIGTIGTRLKRPNRMECEDILISKKQNCHENGYGENFPNSCLEMEHVNQTEAAKQKWRQMWAEFYQIQSPIFEDVSPKVNALKPTAEQCYTERYVNLPAKRCVFDNEVFYKRVSVLTETVLLEAEARARDAGRDAFVNVIGSGLGVWCISGHQPDVYVLTFLQRTLDLLLRNMLQHVTDINFAFIRITPSILGMFSNVVGAVDNDKIFFKCERHPKGGINIHMVNREPSSRLVGEHSGKLLVMMYPWDSNAHPGNEFWYGKLTSSGDPAAACSTQVAELHNAHVNARVAAHNARVAAPAHGGLYALPEHCRNLTLKRRDSP